jgi:hypothetical protein
MNLVDFPLTQEHKENLPVRLDTQFSNQLDIDRLEFPQDIAHVIGVRKETINHWKKKGCPFLQRKTTIRWVRDFIAKEAGAGA